VLSDWDNWMDNKIITMFKTMFNDIEQKLRMTIICSNNDQLFDNNFVNNLQIFD
jgi:hypothetical protein